MKKLILSILFAAVSFASAAPIQTHTLTPSTLLSGTAGYALASGSASALLGNSGAYTADELISIGRSGSLPLGFEGGCGFAYDGSQGYLYSPNAVSICTVDWQLNPAGPGTGMSIGDFNATDGNYILLNPSSGLDIHGCLTAVNIIGVYGMTSFGDGIISGQTGALLDLTGGTNYGGVAYWFDSANGNRLTGNGDGLWFTTAPNPFDQPLNTADTATFAGLFANWVVAQNLQSNSLLPDWGIFAGAEGSEEAAYFSGRRITFWGDGSASFAADMLTNGTVRAAAFTGDASQLDFSAVPTADPAVAGKLWRDGDVLKISNGP